MTGALPVQFGGVEESNNSASITVDALDVNGPVEAGETLRVDVTLAATGNGSATEEIEVTADALGSWSENRTLEGGETTTVTATFDTTAEDAGEYTITASGGGETINETVVVEEPADDEEEAQPEVAITTVETNSPILEGKSLEVTVTVENTGNADWSGELSLQNFDGDAVDDNETNIAAGDTKEITLIWSGDETKDVADNTVRDNITVRAESDQTDTISAEAEVEIRSDVSFFTVEIADAPTEVTEVDDIEVTVEVENIGGARGTQDIEVIIDGLDKQSQPVELAPGETDSLEFTIGTSSGDAGEYELVVSSNNDETTTEITVEEDPIGGDNGGTGNGNGGEDDGGRGR
jgi:hypothetical protein